MFNICHAPYLGFPSCHGASKLASLDTSPTLKLLDDRYLIDVTHVSEIEVLCSIR